MEREAEKIPLRQGSILGDKGRTPPKSPRVIAKRRGLRPSGNRGFATSDHTLRPVPLVTITANEYSVFEVVPWCTRGL